MIIFNVRELFGTLILIILSIVGRTVGLGGSTFAIGIFYLLFDFNFPLSIGYTQLLIFSGTLTSMALKISTRHPQKETPMIDFDLVVTFVGPVLVGLSIGSHFLPYFPLWLILAIFFVLNLSFCSYILYKFIQSIRTPEIFVIKKIEISEIPKNSHSERMSARINSEMVSLNDNQEKNTEENNKNLKASKVNSHRQTYEYFINEDRKTISTFNFIFFLSLFISSVLLSNISFSPSPIEISSCSSMYPITIAIYFVIVIFLNVLSSYYLVSKTKSFTSNGHGYLANDIQWTYKRCFSYFVFGLFFGLLMGFLGMSTGYYASVFFLYIGLTPDVSTITSSFSIFYTSFIPALQFFINGGLDYRYSIWIAGISIIASAFASTVVRPLVIKSKLKMVLLLFLIESVILASLITIVGIYSYNLQISVQDNDFFIGFEWIC